MPDPSTKLSLVKSPNKGQYGHVEVRKAKGDPLIEIEWYCGESCWYTKEQLRNIVADLDSIQSDEAWLYLGDTAENDLLFLRVMGRYLYVATNEGQTYDAKEKLRDQRVSWRRLKAAIEEVAG